MRVLGIDPGSRFLGFGLVDIHGRAPTYAAHGVIRTNPDEPLAVRLKVLFDELTHVIHLFKPDVMAVEGVFTNKNARSALILGHARGIALLLAAQSELPVFEYAPARVKRSVGAGGNDTKDSVARMVTTLLKLKKPLGRSDAYDALAVALCHAHQSRGFTAAASPTSAPGRRSFGDRLRPSFVGVREAAS